VIVVITNAHKDFFVFGTFDNVLIAPVIIGDSDLLLMGVIKKILNATLPVGLPDLTSNGLGYRLVIGD